MRSGLRILLGLALLPCLPAYGAGTEFNVTCIAKDLPAGAKVWMQVEPESYQTPAPTPTSLGAASGAPEPASGNTIWQFDVPAGGSSPPSTHRFTFPTEIQPTNATMVSSIRLKASFKIDAPGQQGAYGEVLKANFGMPVLASNAPLSRCLRLREDENRLILESAPDCSDASFASRGQNGRILLKQPGH